MILNILLLIILLLLSGFFSGLETAYTSLTHIQIKRLKEKNKKKALRLELLKENNHRLITTILIGNNLVNISASALATYMTLQLFGSKFIGVTTGILTILILVFGEVTPKKLAIDYNEFVCMHTGFSLGVLMIIFTPIIWVIDVLSHVIIVIFGRKEDKPKVTEDDIISAVEIGEEIGELEPHEKRMIHNVFRFNDLEVKDIMIHRTDMFSIDEEKKVSEVIKELIKEGYSRVPVYSKTKENISGLLLLKKAIVYLDNKRADPKIKQIMEKPFFVPETRRVDDMLRDFKKKKIHIAVVVDERGGILGIVTIEDVIEEIVGEIYDETDTIHKKINRLNKKTYLIKGDTEIETINKTLGLRIPHKDFDTLSGYILKRAGRIPEQGEEITLKKGKFIIDKIENNRIDFVKFIKK